MILLAAAVLPIALGALLPVFKWRGRDARNAYILLTTLITSVLTVIALFSDIPRLDLIHFSEQLTISLRLDGIGRVFAGLVALLWPLTSLYALDYMRGEEERPPFFPSL